MDGLVAALAARRIERNRNSAPLAKRAQFAQENSFPVTLALSDENVRKSTCIHG
jgi:hypothetical protein